MEYAGLKNLKSYRTWTYVSEPQAVYAGMGLGLCEKWGNLDKCEDEEAAFPLSQTLSITFTHDVLSVTYATAQDARSVIVGSTTTRYDLGLEAWLQNPDSSTYWSKVRDTIHRIASASQAPLDKLLLSGEDASNEQFLEAVREALQQTPLRNVSRPSSTDIDPLYIGANGAAEFAKRWQGGTWNCMEPPHCAGNRDPDDDDESSDMWSEQREEL